MYKIRSMTPLNKQDHATQALDKPLKSRSLKATPASSFRRQALLQRMSNVLSNSENSLIYGAGGGNDSVTILAAREQLNRDFGFNPKNLSVVAMLPDVLSYKGYVETGHPLVWKITKDTKRYVNGKLIPAFPEPLLAKHKSSFDIDSVYGLSMSAGTFGITDGLRYLANKLDCDLIAGCDIGGDFIAAPENMAVLSPMMDSYALQAFRTLSKSDTTFNSVYCVFGLGTDGESDTAMLDLALKNLDEYSEGDFEEDAIAEVEEFYRKIIEPNRASRTADLTFRSIHGEDFSKGIDFRARFHTRPTPTTSKKYYGSFLHKIDPKFSGKYYLFDNLTGIQNPFEVACTGSIDWFVNIQVAKAKPNHELNGQTINITPDLNVSTEEDQIRLFFATPSYRFKNGQRTTIIRECILGLENNSYDIALIYSDDLKTYTVSNLKTYQITDDISAITFMEETEFIDQVKKLNPIL